MNVHTINERGIASHTLIGIVALACVAGVAYYMLQRNTSTTEAAPEVMMEGSEDGVMTGNDSQDSAAMMDEGIGEGMMTDDTGEYIGTVLAGEASPLREFTQHDYDLSLKEGKRIVLYFYANWCPNCKKEFNDTREAFNSLTDNTIVGFRVHYNDNEVTDEMKALARTYGIAYQHTKVFLKDGESVLKSGKVWDAARYAKELKALTQ